MKKLIFGLTAIFIASQLFVSCSSENTVLSQFSKRKYLKNFKEKNVKNENTINEYEYTAEYIESEKEYESEEVFVNEIEAFDDAEFIIDENNFEEVELNLEKIVDKDYSAWNNYNREIDLSNLNFNEPNIETQQEQFKKEAASEILLVILCIFIPPLAVYLYDNSVNTNFWVDLLLCFIFWFPGVIFAFLVCFGGVSL